jgi:hypothetical protein
MTRALSIVALVLVLVGCTGPVVAPSPTAVPSGSPTGIPSPSATADSITLPEIDAVTAALVRPDGTAPFTSFVSTVEPGLAAVFEDGTENAAGEWMTRLACSSATGADLAVRIEPSDGAPIEFTAACAPPNGIVTTDATPFMTTGPYKVTFTSTESAVAAIGLFRAA